MPETKAVTMDPKQDKYQIKVRNLVKTFNGHRVLNNLNLDIERHKINIIIGGSGQGKSVTMKHLMGLIKPDSGQILVDGTDITALSEYKLNKLRHKFGMVFQYAALFDSMTVAENIAFPLVEHTKKTKNEIKEIVKETLESVDLAGIEDKYPAELSGGMQKRVGLARAIVMKPEILFYDEPTTGLDPIATKNVDDLITSINQKFGVTSVVISHDMASTFRIAHRIAMLYGGEIIEVGAPAEFIGSTNPKVRQFLDISGVSVNIGG